MTSDAVFVSFRRLGEDGVPAKQRTVIGLQGEAATAALLLIGAGEYGLHESEIVRSIPRLASVGILAPAFGCLAYDGVENAVPRWHRLLDIQDVQIVEGVAGNA